MLSEKASLLIPYPKISIHRSQIPNFYHGWYSHCLLSCFLHCIKHTMTGDIVENCFMSSATHNLWVIKASDRKKNTTRGLLRVRREKNTIRWNTYPNSYVNPQSIDSRWIDFCLIDFISPFFFIRNKIKNSNYDSSFSHKSWNEPIYFKGKIYKVF